MKVNPVNVSISDNVGVLEMDFLYYDLPSLIEAGNEFLDSCWFAMMPKDDDTLLIRIEPKDETMTAHDAVYSFLNYTLGIVTGKMKDTVDNG